LKKAINRGWFVDKTRPYEDKKETVPGIILILSTVSEGKKTVLCMRFRLCSLKNVDAGAVGF